MTTITTSLAVEAAWKDVVRKARRLRSSGAVNILQYDPVITSAQVQGDHGTYNVVIYRQLPGSKTVTMYDCDCGWGSWAFRRQVTFVGRMCSHALATYYQMQSMDHSMGDPNDLAEGMAAMRHDYVLGSANEELFALPSQNKKTASRTASADMTFAEKQAVLDEEGMASNLHKLDLYDTHYLDLID